MPTLRSNQSNTGATRLYDDPNAGRRCRATPKPDARCPVCGNKHTVGRILGSRHDWYYCRKCALEFNTRSGRMQQVTFDGEVEQIG